MGFQDPRMDGSVITSRHDDSCALCHFGNCFSAAKSHRPLGLFNAGAYRANIYDFALRKRIERGAIRFHAKIKPENPSV